MHLAEEFDARVGVQNWQFVLVDNGSTDRTPEIIKDMLVAYPPSKTVYVAEPNYGAALRAGFNAAEAEFLYTCDVEQWDVPFFAWACPSGKIMICLLARNGLIQPSAVRHRAAGF